MKDLIRKDYWKWLTWAGLGTALLGFATGPSIIDALAVFGWGIAAWTHYYIRYYHNWVTETFGYDPLEKD